MRICLKFCSVLVLSSVTFRIVWRGDLFVLWCRCGRAVFLSSLTSLHSLSLSLCLFMGGVAQCRKCLGHKPLQRTNGTANLIKRLLLLQPFNLELWPQLRASYLLSHPLTLVFSFTPVSRVDRGLWQSEALEEWLVGARGWHNVPGCTAE